MDSKNATALIVSFCLAVGIGGCHQPPKSGQSPAKAGKGQASEPKWTVGWSQLKSGMDAVEVLSLLDEPRHVKVTKVNTTWYYSDRRFEGPHVVFGTREMRVERWRSPKGD